MKVVWTGRGAIGILLLSFMLLLGACGGAGNNDTAGGGSNASGNGGSANQESADSVQSAFPRTVKGAGGEVTITSEPRKVAVVHWGYSDSILLFDLPSVALALPFTEKQSVLHSDSYKPYVDKVEELVIVGENTAVNLEALLAYDPDVIIAGNAINEAIVSELQKIGTTVVIDEEETNVWGDWPALVTKLGEILGQEELAAEYIANFRAQVEEAKEKLADVEGSVAFVQVRENAVWLQGTNYLTQYYDAVGLQAPDVSIMEEGAQLSLEGLSELNPDHLFLGYFNFSDPSLPALTDEWESSAVWGKLKAVESGRVYPINGELALGYGPIGHSYGLQAIVEALD